MTTFIRISLILWVLSWGYLFTDVAESVVQSENTLNELSTEGHSVVLHEFSFWYLLQQAVPLI